MALKATKKTRLYDFTEGGIARSSQVDAELDQFIASNSDIVDDLTALNQTDIDNKAASDAKNASQDVLITKAALHVDNTNNPHNVTAAQINTYTKTELDPYLRGGDTLIIEEIFTIVNGNDGAGHFTYTDKTGATRTGTLDGSGYQIFTFLQGNYELGSNRVEATINDTLRRSVASGGLVEIDTTHIKLTDPQGTGAEITFRYFQKIGIIGTGLLVMSNTIGAYFSLHD